MRRVALDGPDWQVKGYLGREGAADAARSFGPAAPPGRPEHAWLPASVPGSVVADLWRAGEVPDPYVERNSLAIEWVPERAWLYRRRVSAPAPADGERAVLRFAGVDHEAVVYLDGSVVGSHAGMFVPFEIDVTEPLRDGGDHTLAVLIEPAPETEPQIGRTSRVTIHKSRMCYGWDFCPRMIHQGIWKAVTLEIDAGVRLTDVWARPMLAPDGDSGSVDVRVALDVAAGASRRVRLVAELFDGALVAASAEEEADLATRGPVVEIALGLDAPRLWWPNGAGERTIYRLRVRVVGPDGAAIDERTVPVGFRTLALVPNEGAPAAARPYTIEVNGRQIYATGWNWVPLDVLHGVDRRDALRHLLRLAEDAHVNLLRVWGGGLIESDDFYDECDQRGILVWQEFIQSSSGAESRPSPEPAFRDLMAGEAEQIVPLVRNHPSLAIWCGGNELAGPDGSPLGDGDAVVDALRDVVARLDPDRASLPTSPTGPIFHNRLDVIAAHPDGLHDVHGPWEHLGLRRQYELYNAGTSLMNSEFGVEGMTNRRTHEALIGAEHRLPATKLNPVYRHLGDWWINEPLVQESFGARLTDLEQLRRASQFLQAEGLRYAIEANRRRAPRHSGSLPWQFNEPYPNAWCTSAVDHRGDPKAAYHAIRRAYAPVHVSARFERVAWSGEGPFRCDVWAWSSFDDLGGARVQARLRRLDGTELACSEGSVDLVDGRPVRAIQLEAALPSEPLFVLDLELASDTAVLARNRYLFATNASFAPVLDVGAAAIEVVRSETREGWRLEVCHRGGPAALGLTVEDDRPITAAGWAEASDGGFDLLPGERRVIDVRWADAPVDGRRLRVEGWNAGPVVVG